MTKTLPIAPTATLALIAAGFMAATPVAQAAEQENLPSAEIRVVNSDFTSAEAVAHLIKRVQRVALNLCLADGHYEVRMNSDERACYDAAVKTSLAQIETKRQQAMRDGAVHMAAARPADAASH